MSELTRRQRSIYDFIVRQVRRQGIPPTLMEIAEAFELRSVSGVSDHLKAIERKGYIRRRPGASRGIELPREKAGRPARRSTAVPIVAEVPSGRGLARDANGHVFVDSRLKVGDAFAVRTREALPERGILAGDLLVLREGGNGRGGVAVGTQGRNVVLLEVAPDGRTARALKGTFDPRRDVEIRGYLVAVVRCFEELDG